MSQPTPVPPKAPPALYSWSEVWTAALTKPSVTTFTELLRDPGATMRRALLWLYITACISTFMVAFVLINDAAVQEQLQAMVSLPPDMTWNDFSGMFAVSLACMTPFIGIITVLLFLALVWGVHFVAQRLNPADGIKREQLQQLTYAFAAIIAPLNILSLVFVLIPELGLISLVASIYQLTLMLLAIMAVYRFRPMQAGIALAVPMFVFMLLVIFLFGGGG